MPPGFGSNGVLDALALALIALALWTVALKRIDVAILAVAAQAALLTGAALAVAVAEPQHTGHALVAAGLTAAVKVALIPFVLLLVLARVTVRREAAPLLPTKVALAAAVGLVLVAYWAAAPLHLALGTGASVSPPSAGLPTPPGAAAGPVERIAQVPNLLPAALALMLLGLFLMVIRKAALMQVLGLVTVENGMYLLALAATSGLPLAVELAILVDVLIGAILLGIFVYRIGRTFDHIDTDALRTLRF